MCAQLFLAASLCMFRKGCVQQGGGPGLTGIRRRKERGRRKKMGKEGKEEEVRKERKRKG